MVRSFHFALSFIVASITLNDSVWILYRQLTKWCAKPSNNDKWITNRYLFEKRQLPWSNERQCAFRSVCLCNIYSMILNPINFSFDVMMRFHLFCAVNSMKSLVDALWFELINHEPNDAMHFPNHFQLLLFLLHFEFETA